MAPKKASTGSKRAVPDVTVIGTAEDRQFAGRSTIPQNPDHSVAGQGRQGDIMIPNVHPDENALSERPQSQKIPQEGKNGVHAGGSAANTSAPTLPPCPASRDDRSLSVPNNQFDQTTHSTQRGGNNLLVTDAAATAAAADTATHPTATAADPQGTDVPTVTPNSADVADLREIATTAAVVTDAAAHAAPTSQVAAVTEDVDAIHASPHTAASLLSDVRVETPSPDSSAANVLPVDQRVVTTSGVVSVSIDPSGDIQQDTPRATMSDWAGDCLQGTAPRGVRPASCGDIGTTTTTTNSGTTAAAPTSNGTTTTARAANRRTDTTAMQVDDEGWQETRGKRRQTRPANRSRASLPAGAPATAPTTSARTAAAVSARSDDVDAAVDRATTAAAADRVAAPKRSSTRTRAAPRSYPPPTFGQAIAEDARTAPPTSTFPPLPLDGVVHEMPTPNLADLGRIMFATIETSGYAAL